MNEELRAAAERKTPWEMAMEWYSQAELCNVLTNPHARRAALELTPKDVSSDEFIKWMFHLHRVVMAKGIELERGREDRSPLDEATFRRLTGCDGRFTFGLNVSLLWANGLCLDVGGKRLPLPHITTVGDFRRLCSLLGAEVKE